MNLIEQISTAFKETLCAYAPLDQDTLDRCVITINTDAQRAHFGDLSSNAAMILAKLVKQSPLHVAHELCTKFTHPQVFKLEVAQPGFINITLTPEAVKKLAHELFDQKNKFFATIPGLVQQKYNIEYVSANPTGPLHFGHGRGGIIGDVLSRVLKFLGNTVTREFYINDAGVQMQKLGTSLKIRVEQELGFVAEIPEDGYHGAYLVDLAKHCIAEYSPEVYKKDIGFFSRYAEVHMLAQQRKTLAQYGIEFDEWFSERTLHESHSIEAALADLSKSEHLYEQEGATWFKSTKYGDDKDRVVRKASGELTYVAADVAYMRNKINRDFNHLIMCLGHDHHSYVVRLQAVKQALGYVDLPLDIILYQLVKMKASGELVRMSKRAGNIVTLEDVIETVGADVARFFFLHRKADAQLEFDVDLALKRTEENPVYYAQYAYVRCGSVLKKAHEHGIIDIAVSDIQDMDPEERLIIMKLCSLKQVLSTIAVQHQVHTLTYYALELASLFHHYYAQHRIIDPENIPLSRHRLACVQLIRETLALTFDLLGISKPESM